jgi:hypothetical protein
VEQVLPALVQILTLIPALVQVAEAEPLEVEQVRQVQEQALVEAVLVHLVAALGPQGLAAVLVLQDPELAQVEVEQALAEAEQVLQAQALVLLGLVVVVVQVEVIVAQELDLVPEAEPLEVEQVLQVQEQALVEAVLVHLVVALGPQGLAQAHLVAAPVLQDLELARVEVALVRQVQVVEHLAVDLELLDNIN